MGPKNEDHLKNEADLIIEDVPKNEDTLKNEDSPMKENNQRRDGDQKMGKISIPWQNGFIIWIRLDSIVDLVWFPV